MQAQANGRGDAVVVEVHTGAGMEKGKEKEKPLLVQMVPEPKKPLPKPSGVKPRQFLLPTLVVCIMTIPIISLVLPVYLSSEKQRKDDDAGRANLCVLYPLTAAQEASFNTSAGVNAYFNALNSNCSKISDVVFNNGNPNDPSFQAIVHDPAAPTQLGYAYTTLNMQMTAIDPQLSTAVAQADISFGGEGLVDHRGKLNLTNGWVLSVDFLTTNGFDTNFKTGDRSTSKNPKFSAEQKKSIFNYPFDKYNVTVGILVTAENPKNIEEEHYSMPLLVNFKTGLVGWHVEVVQTSQPLDQANYGADTLLVFYVVMSRSSFVKFFAVMILTGMWILTSFAIGYGIDLCYLRPRNAVLGDAALYTGLLFALNGIRGVMPAVPPVGVAVDFFGFIWMMMFMMLMSAQVSSRVIMLYVHPDPTIYDRVFKTEAWHDKVKADKEKKEKELKEKEEKELEGHAKELKA